MKFFVSTIIFIFLFGLTSCLPTKTVAEPKNTVLEINDLSGKWNVNKGSDYIIFEDTTKKMVLKTECGLITADYTKINQAIIFNHLKQVNSECEIPEGLLHKIKKTAYFKVNTSNQITFFDEANQEMLTLNLMK